MIVQTVDLTKCFGANTVVKSVNMSIEKGQVYGFIGMNGAGKSTTIKMIAGLLEPTSGSIELFGENNKNSLQYVRKRISGYVDTPAFYNGMTATQNLEIISRLQKQKKRWSIIEILKIINLENTSNKVVGKFSLGMKQRLAIGCALINNPDLIILDEPINGLDPSGIMEIRDLIKNLSSKFEKTFLISSHILSELEKVATNFGIIEHGKLIEQVSSLELKNKLKQYIRVESKSVDLIYHNLISVLGLKDCIKEEEKILVYQSMDRFDDIKKVVEGIDNHIHP